MKFIVQAVALLLFMVPALSQNRDLTPLEASRFTKLSANEQVVDFLTNLKPAVRPFDLDLSNSSSKGKIIPVVRFPAKTGSGDSTIKILFFAQQHGDEPSGKEAMLMLIRDIADGTVNEIIDYADITIVPQVNPDGDALNDRHNANGADLNRNHLILTEKESSLIHNLYHREQPHFTVDFHEYSARKRDWLEYGALKNYDEQIGCLSNPNIPAEMRRFEREIIMPYVAARLKEKGFSTHEYLVGGPPDIDNIRFSTTDINDGRQSLGLMGSISFIVEGKNGRDSIDDIERRSLGQYNAARAFLSWINKNRTMVRKLVMHTRKKISSGREGMSVPTSEKYVKSGEILPLILKSIASGSDTLVKTPNFSPVVKSTSFVKRPKGYLILSSDSVLIKTLKKHGARFQIYTTTEGDTIFQYSLNKYVSSPNRAGEWLKGSYTKVAGPRRLNQYVYMPLDDINSILLILAVEPASMYGLVKYPEFRHLLAGRVFPVLRVESVNQ